MRPIERISASIASGGNSWPCCVPAAREMLSFISADERKHLACGWDAAWPGIPARGDGGADPLDRPHPAAARHALPPGLGRAARGVVWRARVGARHPDAAAQ